MFQFQQQAPTHPFLDEGACEAWRPPASDNLMQFQPIAAAQRLTVTAEQMALAKKAHEFSKLIFRLEPFVTGPNRIRSSKRVHVPALKRAAKLEEVQEELDAAREEFTKLARAIAQGVADELDNERRKIFVANLIQNKGDLREW